MIEKIKNPISKAYGNLTPINLIIISLNSFLFPTKPFINPKYLCYSASSSSGLIHTS